MDQTAVDLTFHFRSSQDSDQGMNFKSLKDLKTIPLREVPRVSLAKFSLDLKIFFEGLVCQASQSSPSVAQSNPNLDLVDFHTKGG